MANLRLQVKLSTGQNLVDGERRNNETESENDREPDQPHEHLGGGWLAGV
jgi:hypothetical protein